MYWFEGYLGFYGLWWGMRDLKGLWNGLEGLFNGFSGYRGVRRLWRVLGVMERCDGYG